MPIPIPQVRRIPFNDERVGQGFNSESGLAIGKALEGFAVTKDPNAPGQEVDASVTIVNTHEELMDSLGMSFEAHGRYGLFSGSGKAQFSERSNYNMTSTFVIARCVVQNPFLLGEDFRVKPAAQELLTALRFLEFKTAFGDCFVRGLQTGGEFYAVMRITSVSSTTQEDLAASAQGEVNGAVFGAGFKADFATAHSNVSTKCEFSAMMLQRAGSGDQISPTIDIDEVKARFKGFPAIVKESPIAYEAEVATYDTLPLPVPTFEEQEAFLFALLDAREKKLRYIETRNSLDFARRNPIFFEGLAPDDVLANAATAYTKLLNAVLDHAVRLSRGQINPPRVFDPATLTPPIVEPPPIPLKRVKIPVVTPPPPPPPQVPIPSWTNSSELQPDAAPGTPTPRQLGIKVHEFVHLQTIIPKKVGGILILPDLGKITAIDPVPGTPVSRGFTVTVHSIGRKSLFQPEPDGTVVERFID